MKTHAFLSSVALVLTAPTLLTSAAFAQLPGSQNQSAIEALTPHTQSFTVGNLAKKPVRSATGESLGEISEFLIDPRSGRVHFAVVFVGNNYFRIVPMSALQPGSGSDGLILGIDRVRWDQIPPKNEQELLGRVNLDAGEQQQLQQHYQLSAAEPAVNDLLRSTLLNEREVRAGNDRIGKVTDVVIDFHNRISAPVVRLQKDGNSDERVLLHFSHLQVNPEHRTPIIANLSPQDLSAAGISPLTPTGYPSGIHPQAMSPQRNAVAAVHQALERDPSLPRGSVVAIPEHRIILRGSVPNEQKRAEVERTAQQVAPGVQIVNQLMVQNR